MALFAGLAVGVAGAAQQSAFHVGRKESALPRSQFKISSLKLRSPLRPGTSQALDLRLTNRRGFSLAITRLSVAVAVDPAHARAGCDARRDFRVIGMRSGAYPIRLRPRRTAALSGLGVRVLPRVAMVALPRNQDACKGARLTLKLSGGARRWGVGARR